MRSVLDANHLPLETVHYTPYGVGAPTESPHGFTGEPTDANGLVHLRARYYDPALGVFPSLDPMEGNPSQPLSLARYAYVQGNPINAVDPSGLFGEDSSQYTTCQGQNNSTQDCSCCNSGEMWPCQQGHIICPCNNDSCVIDVNTRTARNCKYDRQKAADFASLPNNIQDQFSERLQCPFGKVINMSIHYNNAPDYVTDCANFVSTALYVGGFLQTLDGNPTSDGVLPTPNSWFGHPRGEDHGGRRGQNWKAAPPLHKFLTSGTITDEFGNSITASTKGEMQPGDVIFSKTDQDERGHVAIVTSIQGGEPYVVEHGIGYDRYISDGPGIYGTEHKYDVIARPPFVFIHLPDVFSMSMVRVDHAGFKC